MFGHLGYNYVYTLSFPFIYQTASLGLDRILNYKIPSRWQGTCRSATLGPVLKICLQIKLFKINFFYILDHILILKLIF
jgi:hypothetical protein